MSAAVKPGVRVGETGTGPSITGYVENIGGPAVSGSANVSIASSGTGYNPGATITGVQLSSLTGKGTGGEATLTIDSLEALLL